ncbi:unnamed protein product [Aureobasidium uvarum]|uniref:SGNH hydrolase-type esterase domain-containing protein n=1 Tax=Aureobasidium uvarum TaxID=2773716 RepID=A0A9N8KNY8_9PEZI|nr:unnamed protein product [Aureobasidium uvarum]
MPLGASITEGVRSSDGNGYRRAIRDQLRFKGWKVNMVGSKQNGKMADRDNEGHPGWVISQVHSAWSASAWMKPNLVLLNVGTNDCVQNIDTGNAGTRVKQLIDDIFTSVPGVTIILSTLLPGRDFNTCATSVSDQYRELVMNYFNADPKARLHLADMNAFIKLSDLSDDGIHPLDPGYRKMAAVWWDAISRIESTIQAPANDNGIVDTGFSAVHNCTKVAGNARGPVKSQQGSGHDDGLYTHHSTSKGNVPSGKVFFGPDDKINAAIPEHMFFAQLVNSGGADRAGALDDWVRVEHKADGTNTYWLRVNKGDGTFADHVTFDVDMNCDGGPTYWFADFNNDGLDDFFCLGGGSRVSVSLNRGGNPPKFEHIGQVVPEHAGYTATDVRIADIDGDGRADYCLIGHNGDILCSRNQGQGDSYSWQGFKTVGGLREVVFTAKGKGDASGVRLADLNGDFRSDWMWIGDQGDIDTWINQRGWGTGIVPDWTHSGITHGGDGVFYCDMRNTGSDDYVWIYSDGHADSGDFYANIHEPPGWGHETKITLKVPGPRIGVHLADWNGDGKCDVLVQDKKTGALTMWENRYDASTNTLKFANVGVVTGAATCTQGWGVGIFDRGMAVVDIDGDGRADVLCIEPNGRTTAWLNPKSGLVDVGQIKFSEGGTERTSALLQIKVDWAELILFMSFLSVTSDSGNSGSHDGDGDTDDPDGDGFGGDEDFEVCDFSKTFKNLDDLSAAADGLRSDCIAVYTLETLITMLDAAYANYTSVNDGYDEEFGYYVTYIKKLVPAVLGNSFMFDESHATKYMAIPPVGTGMQYFDCQLGSNKFSCSDYEDHHIEGTTATTTLTLRDADGYNSALLKAGLSPDWVTMGDYEKDHLEDGGRASRNWRYKFSDFPVQNTSMVVPNPKDVITNGLGSVEDLRRQMQATLLDMILGIWTGGSIQDPAQAYSTPVFMLMEAVENMAQAKALGKQEEQAEEAEEEKRKKNFILLIISVVFLVVPFVGEEVALAGGFTTIARTLAIAGELGNAALGIYDTVEDPSSAVVNVLGMLLGVGAIAKASRDGKGISGVASARKGMSADSISSLGSVFKNQDDKLQSIMKVCKF